MAAARSQRVRFTVHCPLTSFGEHVRVVGSPALFGAWAPHRSAVVLGTSEADFPVWRSAWLELPEGLADFEYKYVICRDGCEPRWEARPNRKMQVPEGGTEWLVSAGFDSLQPPACRDVPAGAPWEGDHLPVVMVNVLQQTPRFGGEAHRQASVGAMETLGWIDHHQDVARRCTMSSLGDIKGLVRAEALHRDIALDSAAVVLGGVSWDAKGADTPPTADQPMQSEVPRTEDTTDTAAAVFGITDELPAAEQFMPAKATGVQETPEDDGLSTADTFDDCNDDHSTSEHEVDSVWEGSPKHPNPGGPRGFDEEDDESVHQDLKANNAHLACPGGDIAGSRSSGLGGARLPLAQGALGLSCRARGVDVWAAGAGLSASLSAADAYPDFSWSFAYMFLAFIAAGRLAGN